MLLFEIIIDKSNHKMQVEMNDKNREIVQNTHLQEIVGGAQDHRHYKTVSLTQ